MTLSSPADTNLLFGILSGEKEEEEDGIGASLPGGTHRWNCNFTLFLHVTQGDTLHKMLRFQIEKLRNFDRIRIH